MIANQFFPKTNPTAALLSTLATFAAGFIIRPFGALVFGRLGDIVGRKYTFLLTLILMGGSTFAIGLIPSYESIGFAAPLPLELYVLSVLIGASWALNQALFCYLKGQQDFAAEIKSQLFNGLAMLV